MQYFDDSEDLGSPLPPGTTTTGTAAGAHGAASSSGSGGGSGSSSLTSVASPSKVRPGVGSSSAAGTCVFARS